MPESRFIKIKVTSQLENDIEVKKWLEKVSEKLETTKIYAKYSYPDGTEEVKLETFEFHYRESWMHMLMYGNSSFCYIFDEEEIEQIRASS